MLEAKNISFAIKEKYLVRDISLTINPNEFVVVMGSNGAGKSTLLKMLAGSLHQTKGEVLFHNKPLNKFSSQTLALHRAVLSQHYNIAFPSTAKDIVMMGRYPYFKTNPTLEDEKIVIEAMKKMQIENLAERDYNTLSGGEAQKVQMSRVLAQIGDTNDKDGKLLFLDEPVSHLDVKYQHQLLNVAKSLCNRKVAVFAVLHDINLAIKYADRILFMKQGAMVHQLKSTLELTAEIIKDVFDVQARILSFSESERIVVF